MHRNQRLLALGLEVFAGFLQVIVEETFVRDGQHVLVEDRGGGAIREGHHASDAAGEGDVADRLALSRGQALVDLERLEIAAVRNQRWGTTESPVEGTGVPSGNTIRTVTASKSSS